MPIKTSLKDSLPAGKPTRLRLFGLGRGARAQAGHHADSNKARVLGCKARRHFDLRTCRGRPTAWASCESAKVHIGHLQ
eukprot:9554509-Alexandrium_andersonii.AAC.1